MAHFGNTSALRQCPTATGGPEYWQGTRDVFASKAAEQVSWPVCLAPRGDEQGTVPVFLPREMRSRGACHVVYVVPSMPSSSRFKKKPRKKIINANSSPDIPLDFIQRNPLTCAYDRRLSRFKTEDSIPLLRYSRQYSLSY